MSIKVKRTDVNCDFELILLSGIEGSVMGVTVVVIVIYIDLSARSHSHVTNALLISHIGRIKQETHHEIKNTRA